MDRLPVTIVDGFVKYYEMLGQRAHTLSDSLSEEEIWENPFPYGNSFGHLALHIIGNLNYYIGSLIAITGYVRDRDREFTETERLPKAELLRRLDETVEMVVATIKEQSADDWSREYTAIREEDAGNRFNILLKCAIHFYHHRGQMIYLVKEISRQRHAQPS